ncbi:MAG: nucleoside 2-deoxyribosyltransferase [bacterium]
MGACLFCKKECEFGEFNLKGALYPNVYIFYCDTCGTHLATRSIFERIGSLPVSSMHLNCIYENIVNKKNKGVPILWLNRAMLKEKWDHISKNIRVFEDVATKPIPHVDKMNSILQKIEQKVQNGPPFTWVHFSLDDLYALRIQDHKEFEIWIKQLMNMGLVNAQIHHPFDEKVPVSLTPEGWQHINQNKISNTNQVFVAMNFDVQYNDIWETISKTLKETSFLTPYRVDKENFDDEKICEKIMSEIRKSRLLIADVTGGKQGVYFEAGYAMGLGIPVVWTCKKTDNINNDMHFDTRQYQHIIWEKPEDLASKLKAKVEALYLPLEVLTS